MGKLKEKHKFLTNAKSFEINTFYWYYKFFKSRNKF